MTEGASSATGPACQVETDERSERRADTVPRWLDVGAAWGGRALVLVAVAALAVLALSKLLFVVVPVLVALFLASVLHGPTDWLRRRGLPDAAAALAVVLGFLVVVAAAVALVGTPAVAQADDLGPTLQGGMRRAASSIAKPFGISPNELVRGVNDAARRVVQGGGAGGVIKGLGAAAAVLAGVILSLVVLFFFLKDGKRMWSAALRRSRRHGRDWVERFGRRSWRALHAYFLGVTTVALIDAVLIGLALLAVGVPLVLPLAVLTFVAAYFPIIGATVAGAVGVLVALVSGGVVDAAIIAAVTLAVQQLEGNVLYPWVMRGRVALHPLTTILSVAVGATVAGVLGAFLSVPIAAVVSETLAEETDVGPL